MSGLAEIIEQNRILREKLVASERLLQEKELVLAAKDQALVEKDQAHREELAKRDAMLAAVKARAEELAQHLEFLKLKQKGPASQRFIDSGQEELPFLHDIEPPPRAPKPEPAEAADEGEDTSDTKKGGRKGRKPKRRNRADFAGLPSRPVTCRADEDATCGKCGGNLKVIGKASSFRVNWVPGHFIVDDVVRDKCACPSCPGEGVLTVPAPYALERSICGDGLLARVLVDKFADHLPLNRQAKRLGREGFQVSTNTLAGWVKRGAQLLQVVAGCIQSDLMTQSFLQGDDTGYPVQDAGDGTLRKGRLWAFTDQEQVFYAFTATKEGEYPAALLAGYVGELLLVDGGSEFNQVVREQELQRAGCWSHLRTYFFYAQLQHPEAALALNTIQDLFLLERSFAEEPPDKRRELRQVQAKPLVEGLMQWVQAMSTHTRPRSKLGKALTYATNQAESLKLYLEYGELPMHNNLSELMLRHPVVGRKNWLFARTEGGAVAAATMYTLIGSCMLQGLDPHEYLVDVLKRLPSHPVNRVHELTPRAWRLAREGHMVETA